jgi:alpha-galactosidase
MNMINSFLGRIHLASRLFELDEEKKALVKEGVAYYKSLSPVKKQGLPYLPFGLTDFRKEQVASGFVSGNTLYLAVWHLKGDNVVNVPIPEGVKSAKIAFPSASDTALTVSEDGITLTFPREEGAAFLEIDLK